MSEQCVEPGGVTNALLARLAKGPPQAGEDGEVNGRNHQQEQRRLRPSYTVTEWLQDGKGWSDNAVFLAEFQRIADGLRKAGLPE